MSEISTASNELHRSPDYPPVSNSNQPHPEEPKRLNATEARQGKNVRGMVLVLTVSMVLVILGFAAAYLWA